METILITGGSGTIGKALSKQLNELGYEVRHLSRTVTGTEQYKTFRWNLSSGYIEPQSLENINHIIHLAGENVSNKRWSDEQKDRIISSRIDTANMLFGALKDQKIKSYISASGISYYGAKTTETNFNEEAKPADDFLAEVSVKWENSAKQFDSVSDRVVMIRTGIVLSPKDGALEKMVKPIKMGVGSPLGTGKQYMPWIHLDDIVGIYVKAVCDAKMNGIYNAVTSEPCTNANFVKAIAKTLNKNLWAPKVPAFLLRLLFGEMAVIILEGSKISNQKIKSAGYEFNYDSLEPALKNLLKSD